MTGVKMARLVALMARLRSPDGCPWDREQTHETLKIHLIEEAYEVIDAIESGNMVLLEEELGDLLLQIVFHSRIAEENQLFDLDDVIEGIHDKLVRRHPHVFGGREATTSGEVIRNWEAIKSLEADEGGQTRESLLDGTPRSMPPLARAFQLTSRAARVGFDWPNVSEVLSKFEEELEEIRQSLRQEDRKKVSEEIGDLLFVLVNLARHLHVDPDRALNRTNEKFIARFQYVEQRIAASGRGLSETTLEEMDAYWEEAKVARAAHARHRPTD